MRNIQGAKKEYESILTQLSDPELISDADKFEILSKKKSRIERIIEKAKEVEETKNKIEENKSIITAKEDVELSLLAETEINQLKERQEILEKELENLLKGLKGSDPGLTQASPQLHEGQDRDSSQARQNFVHPPQISEKFERASQNLGGQARQNFASQNLGGQAVIVEIRAGTGGEESALFAADLFRMYSKYAERQSWKAKVLDSRPSELAGLKEIVFELKDGDVLSEMKYEGGVHRVQRIPITEKTGRVHTSTASVVVLPKPKKAEIKINPNDLKIETYKASGPGGQYVNKRMTAVRITHLPTGMVVTSQTERNLQQNKENAMSILETRLLEKKEMAELEKLGEKRKTQIKWAKRAEKIRTYNFPQDRVTDHRIKKSWHDIEGIMAGKLESILKSLQNIKVD